MNCEIKGRLIKGEADKQVQKLEAEVKQMRNSLSWKVGWPMRYAARRFPRIAALVSRMLHALINVSKPLLPSEVANHLVFSDKWSLPEEIVTQIEKYRKSPETGKRKIVLFTAIFGEYDKLLLPERIESDVDYVCFTDQPRNNYGVWQIRAAPYYHPDPTRIARYVKTHPHELFPDHDIAVWIDANIILRADIHKYIDLIRQNRKIIGLILHPLRNCFYEEAKVCQRLRKDKFSIINAQVEEYRQQGVRHGAGLFETNFMVVFLEDKRIHEIFDLWWQQIERFSRRDQLALCLVAHKKHLMVETLLSEGKSVRDHEDFHYFLHDDLHGMVIPHILLQLGQDQDPLTGLSFSEVKQIRLEPLLEMPLDIVICVYNALEDVRICLDSVREHLLPRHQIILVNDCSNEQTTEFLREFAADCPQTTLLENEVNLGYTRSANRGLAASKAEFRILLNSDTIVCKNWSLKMLDIALQSSNVGVVGPLSNAASSQSIPNIQGSSMNTAINRLPQNVSPHDLDIACEHWSFAHSQPEVPLVHGFCFGIKKKVIDRIGFFDDRNFDRYYGEENDYCFRASSAGFRMVIATHTFVYHRKSGSIEENERLIHMKKAGKRFREMYGTEKVKLACLQMEQHPLLKRMRFEARQFFKYSELGG